VDSPPARVSCEAYSVARTRRIQADTSASAENHYPLFDSTGLIDVPDDPRAACRSS
jgi:hypothetical protein